MTGNTQRTVPALACPTSMTYPGGNVLDLKYGTGENDKLGRVEKLNWDSGDVVKYDYLGMGQVVIQKYTQPTTDIDYTLATGSGANPYSGMDRFGRIVDLQWNQSATQLVHLKYGYDRASNKTFCRDEVARTNSASFDELYGYDGLHRLDNYDRGQLNGTNTSISGSPTLTQDWTLDSTGNWNNYQQDVVDALDQDRTHNTVNEITGITQTVGLGWATPAEDANGNMTTIPQPEKLDDSFSGVWDAWNRLVKLTNDADSDKTVAEFEYDGLNRRIIKKSYDSAGTLDQTKHYYLSNGNQVLEERIDSSTTASQQFVWGLRFIDDLILRDRDTTSNGTLDERLYALSDTRFSIVALTDTAGTVQERFAYQPYGQSEVLTPAFAPRATSNYDWQYRYTGRELDLETGLYYFRARYYHAQLGRFVSRDPLGFVDGMSLYRAYFVPGAMDPSGEMVVTTISAEKESCGGRVVKWNFKLSNEAPCNGYIVQKITLRENINDCSDCPDVTDIKPTSVFWEAWHVAEKAQMPDEKVGFIDSSTRGSRPDTCGYDVAVGEIKFFCTSKMKPDDPSGWPIFNIETNAGVVSSTTTPPSWWNNTPVEGPVTRFASSYWNCCECESEQHNDLYFSPAK